MFESVAKTNTTHTESAIHVWEYTFESVAKTNTTHTWHLVGYGGVCLRVLLKQILPTPTN